MSQITLGNTSSINLGNYNAAVQLLKFSVLISAWFLRRGHSPSQHLKFIQVESVQDLPLFALFLEYGGLVLFLVTIWSTRGRGNDIAEQNDVGDGDERRRRLCLFASFNLFCLSFSLQVLPVPER